MSYQEDDDHWLQRIREIMGPEWVPPSDTPLPWEYPMTPAPMPDTIFPDTTRPVPMPMTPAMPYQPIIPNTTTSPNTLPNDDIRKFSSDLQYEILLERLRNRYPIEKLEEIVDFMDFMMQETEWGDQYRVHRAEEVLRGDGNASD